MNWDTIRFIIELAVFILSGLGAVIAVTWRVSNIFKLHQIETDQKILRVYSRLDEYKGFIEAKMDGVKKDMKEDFVCKNVCKILHDQNDKNFERVEAKVDTLAVKFDEGIREIMKAMQAREQK
jgi:tRNA A37 threonylcarbamoyladenosine synthetase subunit TsaC/SUA5/YrdC